MTKQTISPAWADALKRYAEHTGGQISPATLRTRMGLLRTLAADLGGTPGTVSADAFAQWVASLSCSARSASNYALAARAFYGWAAGAGITAASPVPAATPPAERGRREAPVSLGGGRPQASHPRDLQALQRPPSGHYAALGFVRHADGDVVHRYRFGVQSRPGRQV